MVATVFGTVKDGKIEMPSAPEWRIYAGFVSIVSIVSISRIVLGGCRGRGLRRYRQHFGWHCGY